MLRNIARITLAIIALASLPVFGGDPYLDDAGASASDIAQGSYDVAVQEAGNALVHRSDDPLAHIALATALLHTRNIERAQVEFAAADKLVDGHPLALYGLGLCLLAKADRAGALEQFKSIPADDLVDTASVIAYLAALGGDYPSAADASGDPALRQVAAQGYLEKREFERAREISLGIATGQKGFIEEFGAVVTFEAARPVALTAPGLAKAYQPPLEVAPAHKRVSGTLMLRVDMPRGADIAYVLFYVDDAVVGIINHPPYECQVDTRRLANAPHTIRIEGRDSSGAAVSEKKAGIYVFNKDQVKMAPAEGEDVRRIEAKLWESLRLKPSRRLAYYTAMKCSDGLKDTQASLAAVEALVGIDPNFKDARTLLLRRYQPAGQYTEVWRVKTDQKLAALTFDDGPNIGTPKLLDILAAKGVKATFFVVGSMAEQNVKTLKLMADSGHEIESHTYSHRNLEYIPDADIERELMRNQSVIRGITGQVPGLFRAPGGRHNASVGKIAAKYGLSQVMWTVNCGQSEGKKPETMINQVMNQTIPGSVILMHNTEPITMQALPAIIDRLRAKGYKLVTLQEMLKAGPADGLQSVIHEQNVRAKARG